MNQRGRARARRSDLRAVLRRRQSAAWSRPRRIRRRRRAERFRLELVSLGEHLRQVVDAVRQRRRGRARARSATCSRALTRSQPPPRASASATSPSSFGAHSAAASALDAPALAALDDLASVLSAPGAQGERSGRARSRARRAVARRNRHAPAGLERARRAAIAATEPERTPGPEPAPRRPSPRSTPMHRVADSAHARRHRRRQLSPRRRRSST